MRWNYRIAHDDESDTYGVYSAYYSEDGQVISISEQPAQVAAESLAELQAELARLSRALEAPVLRVKDFRI